MYLGHEITADTEADHHAYHTALDAFFDQAEEAGMGRMADMDAIAEEEDVGEMLMLHRKLTTWQYLAVELSSHDMIDHFDMDIDSSDFLTAFLDSQKVDYLRERSVYYHNLLTEQGIDCIEIMPPADDSPVEIIDL